MLFRSIVPTMQHRRPPSPLIPICLTTTSLSQRDYEAYVEEREGLLQNPRFRCAALMRGGIIWRLVASKVSFSEVFDGPTTIATVHGIGEFLPGPSPGTAICDDILSDGEADLLCGLVYNYTGER